MSKGALDERTTYRHWINVQTRWADNDMYGHVNNAVHYQWFDMIVNGWLIDRGLLNIEGEGLIGLVVETSCRYAKSLAYPETVDVGLSLSALGNSSVTYGIGIFAKGDQAAAAQGSFTHVYVDPTSRRPVPVPEMWRSALRMLQAPCAAS